jgi:hypothetical protein
LNGPPVDDKGLFSFPLFLLLNPHKKKTSILTHTHKKKTIPFSILETKWSNEEKTKSSLPLLLSGLRKGVTHGDLRIGAGCVTFGMIAGIFQLSGHNS